MPSYRLLKSGWRAEIRLTQPDHYEQQTGFRTKRDAINWAIPREEQIRSTKKNLVRRKTFGDAMQRFSDEVAPTRNGHRWEVIRLKKLKRTDLSSVYLSELGLVHIDEWRDESLKTLKPDSVNREFSLMQSVLKQAIKWNWIGEYPFKHFEKPAGSLHRIRLFSDEELALMKKGFEIAEPIPDIHMKKQQVGVMFMLSCNTGMRRGEVGRLEWPWIDFEARVAALPAWVTKSKRRREVPLSTEAMKWLKIMLGPMSNSETVEWAKRLKKSRRRQMQADYDSQGKPELPMRVFGIPLDSISSTTLKVAKRMGVENARFHDTRHYAATHMKKHLDPFELCLAFGWTNPKQAMTYYNARGSDIANKLP